MCVCGGGSVDITILYISKAILSTLSLIDKRSFKFAFTSNPKHFTTSSSLHGHRSRVLITMVTDACCHVLHLSQSYQIYFCMKTHNPWN